MAYTINENKCLKCGTCFDNCPVNAIKYSDNKYVVDESICIECGLCAANCPANCIKL